MKIRILAAGRFRNGPEKDLYDQYAARLAWPVDLVEIEDRRKLPPERRKRAETEKILGEITRGTALIACDATGKQIASESFAKTLQRFEDSGRDPVTIVIGGAEGLGTPVLDRADLVLGLGRMTWPHLLVRGLIAEQLFRAQAILSGHPYHR